MEQAGRVVIPTLPGPPLPQPGLESHHPCQDTRLPGQPVLEAVRQQGMSGDETHMRRHRTSMQWLVMYQRQLRMQANTPAVGPGSAAKVDIFVIEEETRIEAAQF